MNSQNSYSRNVFITILVIILFACSVFAGTTGKIAGIVTDKETGNPLPGANVILVNTTRGASTDNNGYFYILNVQPGRYSLKSSVIGYKIMTVSDIRVQVDLTSTVNFELNSTVLEGEEVIVTAERLAVELDVTGSQIIMDIGYLDRAPIADLRGAISQQTGIQNTGTTSFIRGGTSTELNVIMDGTSLNSGIIGDNYQGMNTTAIQEIAIMTGGFNAEYGQAMSGIVNIITRQASTTERGIQGSFQYKTRPAGKYHWGANMYSKDLLKYTEYDLGYWNGEAADAPDYYAWYFNTYFGPGTPTNDSQWNGTKAPTGAQLLDKFDEQMTPDPIMGDYTERTQHEFEGTIYGSFMDNMSFLVSGRYLKGVNIFPQAQEYNPEYNIQAKFDYHISTNQKVTLSLMKGYYKSAGYTTSNWNNMETAQEARWQRNAEVTHPYWEDNMFAPWGGQWQKGPQEKDFFMSSLAYHHMLSNSTFYDVHASYVTDLMEELADYSKMTQPLSVVPWGNSQYDLTGAYNLNARYVALGNRSDSKVVSVKADLVSQVSDAHKIKTGVEFKSYNLDYKHYWFEFAGTDIWHLDNVWDGKPMEFSTYIQDKLEYPGSGIVANIGLRLDAFNANKKYPSSIFDPLGIQPWNGGDGVRPSNISNFWPAHTNPPIGWFTKEGGTEPNNDYSHYFPDEAYEGKNTVDSEWKFALAPRIGISFPITATSKLRFNYGHFYQRPSWTKLMGFPISWQDNDPYNTARMDQWAGWSGNPGLEYERTIQYELGFTKSMLEKYRLDLVGFYKDQSKMTQFGFSGTYSLNGSISDGGWDGANWETFSIVHSSASQDNNNVFYTNNAYRDIRGLEATFERLFNGVWSARLTVNYSLNTGGVNGYWMYDEDEENIHQPHGFEEAKGNWLSSTVVKGDIALVTPRKFGILGDISVAFYYEWFSGPEYTYYSPDYTGLQRPNNKRWSAHKKGDLKFTKQFVLGGVSPIIGLEIYNLFNNHDENLLGGYDLTQWEEEGILPQAGVLDWTNTEDDIWWFYNSRSNPKRMIYLTLALEL